MDWTEMKTTCVSWFSSGVSSAVASWLERDRIDRNIYIDIEDQHPDSIRFLKDVEQWIGKPIEIIKHPLGSVEAACKYRQFINGPKGASCTKMLKRDMRKQWELESQYFNWFRYVWGFDKNEQDRADDRVEEMPNHEHVFPLIEHGISKKEAHAILERAGIKRPVMYDLGFGNNNCVGCVKGGKGYWNQIRIHFPEVFAARSRMEREIGASCINGTYLDELDPKAGRNEKPIAPECGAACSMIEKKGTK